MSKTVKIEKSRLPVIMVLLCLSGILISNCKYRNSGNEDVKNKNNQEENFLVSQPEPAHVNNQKSGKMNVNLDESLISWRGTKLMGTGKHEGTLKFKDGYLLFHGDSLIGGKLTADMRSIFITDIPLSDPVPRRNLTEHLNSDFDTELYPVAGFEIAEVSYSAENALQIAGDLTIREITRPIVITATTSQNRSEYKADFTFDRFGWNIGADGSWLEKKLVDAEISVQVLVTLSISGEDRL